ncbi:MAG: response regulator transcription factor [Kiloniellales bacterium]
MPRGGSRTEARAEAKGGAILIVEDDRNIAALVKRYLEAAGFETMVAHDGRKGLELAQRCAPQLVILDVMLPGIDGWDICRALRRDSEVPILMLTAREEETDRIVGFSLGADDYVVKPFSPRELVERVKAILRRAGGAAHSAALAAQGARDEVLRHGALLLDPDRFKLLRDGVAVPLTPTEFKLLRALMRRPGRVFTRDELLAQLYPHGESVIDRVIDVHIGKLRHKIEADPANPRYIYTVHGVGYRFAEADEA